MPSGQPIWVSCAAFCLLTACRPIANSPAVPASPAIDSTPIIGLTLPPEFTPTPSITSAPTDTAAWTNTPIPHAVPETREPGTGPAEPCDNVLYPLSPGREWTYRSRTGDTERTAVVSVTGTKANTAAVEILDQSSGQRHSSTVLCDEGALTGFSAIEVGFLFFQPGTLLSVSSESGVLAPAQRDLEQHDWDYSWTTNLLSSGAMTVESVSFGEMELVFQDSPLRIEWQTAGAGDDAFEAVTTHAGSFSRALKVKATARFSLTVNMLGGSPGQSIPVVLVLESSLWYQPNVGLVKQRFDSGYMEYSGITCAMEIPTQMELWGYTFA